MISTSSERKNARSRMGAPQPKLPRRPYITAIDLCQHAKPTLEEEYLCKSTGEFDPEKDASRPKPLVCLRR